jgi:hypothetical protein
MNPATQPQPFSHGGYHFSPQGDQLRTMAVLSLSAKSAHGRRNAGGTLK